MGFGGSNDRDEVGRTKGRAIVSGRTLRTAAVAGIGQTRYAKNMGRSELDLATEAIRNACADAGLPVSAVDGFASYHIEQVAEVDLINTMGIPELRFLARTPSGGGGGASILGLAAMAVESGAAECVVAFRARNRSKAASYGSNPNQGGRPWEKGGSKLTDFRQWQHPFGVAAPAHEMALIARRHMHVYGTRAEHFGMQAVAQRFHASRNPNAIMRDEITLEDWAASRPIAEPARLFDCSLENDGAAAVLVTTLERARDLQQPAVQVLGHVQLGAPIHTELAEFFATTAAFNERESGAVVAGRRLFERAGLTPADVDVAQIVEPFTLVVPLALEQYGFCGMGEGGPFIESGATRWPDGDLPVNTHGGSTSEAFIHGANHLPEAVRQIRGTAVNQVEGAEVSFVCGAISDPSGAVLLGVDR
jgi:acetyl-CoA acetyltransferase